MQRRRPRADRLAASRHLGTMVRLPGSSLALLCALLHAVAPWGAHRPDRPKQCDAPQSVSRGGLFFGFVVSFDRSTSLLSRKLMVNGHTCCRHPNGIVSLKTCRWRNNSETISHFGMNRRDGKITKSFIIIVQRMRSNITTFYTSELFL